MRAMSECSLMTRWCLAGGGLLAVVGVILWVELPIPLGCPPYLPTAFLALGYGVSGLIRSRFLGSTKS